MNASAEKATGDDYDYCARNLERLDRDRYLIALSTDSDARRHLLALYAFNLELLRIPEIVSETHLGLMRVQWWRDTVDLIYDEDRSRSHQVVRPLAAAIRDKALSRDLFAQLLTAREGDLMQEPPADVKALLARLDHSLGALTGLSLEIVGARMPETQEAASLAAKAYGLQGLARSLALPGGNNGPHLLRSLLAKRGQSPEKLAEPEQRETILALSRGLCSEAEKMVSQARSLRKSVPGKAIPVLQFARLAEIGIRDLEAAGWDPFQPRAHAVDTARAWRLILGKLLRRY